jgi:hypothetical protein
MVLSGVSRFLLHRVGVPPLLLLCIASSVIVCSFVSMRLLQRRSWSRGHTCFPVSSIHNA